LSLGADRLERQVVTRRNGNGRGSRDQDLALALLRIEAAFGRVEVLEVRPNPRPAGQPCPDQDAQAREETAQAVLDLDGHQDREGGEAVVERGRRAAGG
jgi:hypothetical protein